MYTFARVRLGYGIGLNQLLRMSFRRTEKNPTEKNPTNQTYQLLLYQIPPIVPPRGKPQKPKSSQEHIKAFERAIKRGATGEDIAHATYEQIISTWGDKEAIRKWLTPLTICRPANLTRLCDAWRFRSEAERSKLIRQIHGVGPRTSGYTPTGGASNEGYNLRKLIEKQNAPRYD